MIRGYPIVFCLNARRELSWRIPHWLHQQRMCGCWSIPCARSPTGEFCPLVRTRHGADMRAKTGELQLGGDPKGAGSEDQVDRAAGNYAVQVGAF